MRKLLVLSLIGLFYTISSCTNSETNQHSDMNHEIDGSNAPAELKLTPKFKELLKKEMQGIQLAMQEILPFIAKGESEKAAKLAEQIHNSFILKNALTPEELKQLVQFLPAHFVKIDRVFHSDAAKLAEAAKHSDFAKSAEIYGGMLNSCVNCHSSLAAEQFPGLQKSETEQ